MRCELIANRRANEIGAIRIKPFLHEQVDVPQIDGPDVDRDFFGLGQLGF